MRVLLLYMSLDERQNLRPLVRMFLKFIYSHSLNILSLAVFNQHKMATKHLNTKNQVQTMV